MTLRLLQRTWDQFGGTDPLWAILTDPAKRGNRWETGEFFATGRGEIQGVLKHVAALGLEMPHRRALDFGCGVGRLTRALGEHFESVDGVDIAPPMIALARRFHPETAACRFHVNRRSSLDMFADRSFDFIYSNITLQHMPPRLSRRYIREFLRLLAAGGVLVFQLPGTRRGLSRWRSAVAEAHQWYLRLTAASPFMEMHGVKKERVIRLVESRGGRVVQYLDDGNAGLEWTSHTYYVTRNR